MVSVRATIGSALREVTSKSEAAIERETAMKWAARALACQKRYDETGALRWLLRAESYRHEAIEHAALAGTGVLRSVRQSLASLTRARLSTARGRY